jgi:hypothetical protein
LYNSTYFGGDKTRDTLNHSVRNGRRNFPRSRARRNFGVMFSFTRSVCLGFAHTHDVSDFFASFFDRASRQMLVEEY